MAKLVDPTKIDETEFKDFIAEFIDAKENLVPYSINQKSLDFSTYIKSLIDESLGKGIPENWVPASTYFLINTKERILGAVNIRHRLTDSLKIEGGHVGYGIRPSERNKSYGTKILSLALEIIREMGIKRALVTCDKENIGSAKIILNNGGKLESEIDKNNLVFQRYWIDLNNEGSAK